MSYQALYRVWRPSTFAEVMGQGHITQTLINAVRQESIAHAYLFSGPRGTGKTSTAKLVAKAVNCARYPSGEPCNECPACKGINQGRIVDVVEIDAASNNGVDEIRDIRDKVNYAPTEVRQKVYIIDEVHMLSQGAFNALLKTLEEPPPHVLFILATTEAHKIPLTIVSRCQRFDFRRISNAAMVERLENVCQAESIEIDADALQLIARVAEGGMRDALSLLDQALSFASGRITMADCLAITGSVADQDLAKLTDVLYTGHISEAIQLIDDLLQQGKEPLRLVEDLIYYYRDMMLYQTDPELEEVMERASVNDTFKQQVAEYDRQTLFHIVHRLSAAQHEMRGTHHPRVLLEVACIQLARDVARKSDITREMDADDAAPTAAVGDVAPASTSLPASPAESAQITEMQATLRDLQAEVERLKQQRAAATTVSDEKVASTSAPTNDRPKTAPARTSSRPLSAESVASRVRQMLAEASKSRLIQFQEKWPGILETIRQRKITVHAWLRDCQPVACSESYFLLAFQTSIHRETTERESHRQLIEEVVADHCQMQAKMLTIMYNDWETIKHEYIQAQNQSSTRSTDTIMHHQQDGDSVQASSVQRQGEQNGEQPPSPPTMINGETDISSAASPDKGDSLVEEARKLVGDNLLEVRE